MRVKNLFIIVAIIAAIWLVIRYFYQVRNLRRGYNRVSGGRVFLNWFLAIVLVVSLVGVGITSFAAHRTEGVTPSKTSTKSVSPAKSNSDGDNDEVVLKFKKSARLDENGEARVKFLVSPQTKVVIRGHRSGEVFTTFKPGKGSQLVTRSFTFDVAGDYDITAQRGKHKVVKHLKIKGQALDDSSSSMSVSPSSESQLSSSSSASSSSVVESQSSSTDSSSSTTTGSNGGSATRSSHVYRGSGYGSSHRYYGGAGSSATDSTTASSENTTADGGTVTEQP